MAKALVTTKGNNASMPQHGLFHRLSPGALDQELSIITCCKQTALRSPFLYMVSWFRSFPDSLLTGLLIRRPDKGHNAYDQYFGLRDMSPPVILFRG